MICKMVRKIGKNAISDILRYKDMITIGKSTFLASPPSADCPTTLINATLHFVMRMQKKEIEKSAT